MSDNSISITVKNVKALKKEIKNKEKQCEEVIKKTMSDFKSRAPAWVSQSVTEVYNIKKADVKSTFKGAKKAPGKIKIKGTLIDNVQLHYKGRSLTPTHFKMKPTIPPKKRAKEGRLVPGQAIKSNKKVGEVARVVPPAPYQISAEVFKGQRTAYHGNVFLGSNGRSFIPFIRKGPKRNDIKAIKTVSVPQMIEHEKVSESITERIEEGLGKRLQHHLERELQKK